MDWLGRTSYYAIFLDEPSTIDARCPQRPVGQCSMGYVHRAHRPPSASVHPRLTGTARRLSNRLTGRSLAEAASISSALRLRSSAAGLFRVYRNTDQQGRVTTYPLVSQLTCGNPVGLQTRMGYTPTMGILSPRSVTCPVCKNTVSLDSNDRTGFGHFAAHLEDSLGPGSPLVFGCGCREAVFDISGDFPSEVLAHLRRVHRLKV